MTQSFWLICWTALGIGIFHTLTGPDHYLPFVMLARANRWSRRKLLLITTICGAGHVLSSIFLGLVGIFGGVALKRLEVIESTRGEWAACGMILFGILYALWGLKHAWEGEPHTHIHVHEDGEAHHHHHSHDQASHAHSHQGSERNRVWWLFIIFVLGPCEPLIPLLMFPAATVGPFGVLAVSAVFAFATIGTMNLVTLLAFTGMEKIRFPWVERYAHVFAGSAIALSGLAVQFLGL